MLKIKDDKYFLNFVGFIEGVDTNKLLENPEKRFVVENVLINRPDFSLNNVEEIIGFLTVDTMGEVLDLRTVPPRTDIIFSSKSDFDRIFIRKGGKVIVTNKDPLLLERRIRLTAFFGSCREFQYDYLFDQEEVDEFIEEIEIFKKNFKARKLSIYFLMNFSYIFEESPEITYSNKELEFIGKLVRLFPDIHIGFKTA